MLIKGEFHHHSFVLVCSLCTLVNFACFVLVTSIFKKKSFRNTIRVSNRLDQDQARHFITSTCNVTNPERWNTDVGPLERLSTLQV